MTPSTFTEERVPLEGIDETIALVASGSGGHLVSSTSGMATVMLPLKRGAAGLGMMQCQVSWPAGATDGPVSVTAEQEGPTAKMRVVILVIGVIGATAYMWWPFFPNLGPIAWIGAVVAFGAYFMTLKRTPGGIASEFLERLAGEQFAGREGGNEGSEAS